MINIVIPMAGQGSRFAEAGYEKPKPFIDVNGKPMIWRVLENLAHPDANYILIARSEHLEQEKQLVRGIEEDFNASFHTVDHLTEGTACTVLHARELLDATAPLLIANSDQIVDINITEFTSDCYRRGLDGSILTFEDLERNPKWSFAKLDDKGYVSEVQEKQAISEFATVGIYFFKKAGDFVEGALDMILAMDKVNNEYYTCPVYNYLIKRDKNIGIYNIDKKKMHGVGTPHDLNAYLRQLE